jgi:hypothetical protein
MVGIHKKVKKLLDIIQTYSPFLSAFVPGLGEIVGSLSEVGKDVADGVNNIYEDYSTAQNEKRKYRISDGIQSFVRKPKKINFQGAVNTLTNDYGKLHSRLKLKDSPIDDE